MRTERPSGTYRLVLGHLYPDQLNVYGDRGNIITLRERCRWRGIKLDVVPLEMGAVPDPQMYDLYFIGGGQDREQVEVARDLRGVKAGPLREAIEMDVPVLAVCGGYQLLGRFYRPAEGPDMEGLGILDAWTIHRGSAAPRLVGNVALSWNGSTLVGFENHGGRTYLGENARPLGRVLVGSGNNGEDGGEGCVYRKVFGTYLHGSLLPKNPHFADEVLRLALQRRYGDEARDILTPLDDRLEWQAHRYMLERLEVALDGATKSAASSTR